MMRWLDRLNLQPQERRWLLVGIVVLAVVLNYWLVWPYFSEWTEVQQEISRLSGNRTKFVGELSRKSGYELQLKELQLAGAEVLQEDQANRLQATIQSKASEFGVTVGNIRPIASAARTGQTNAFLMNSRCPWRSSPGRLSW